jgi:hypothetical protein
MGQPGEGLAPDGVSVRTRIVGHAERGGCQGVPGGCRAGDGRVPSTGTFAQTLQSKSCSTRPPDANFSKHSRTTHET